MNAVEVSNRLMDLPFISRILRANHLNPIPQQGFYLNPAAWAENGDFKRTIEKYDWGVVIFLSNRKEAMHITIVAVGDFDPATGIVSSRAGVRHKLPVPWYTDMVRSLGDKKVPQVDIQIPGCLGHHEDDAGTDSPVCDGGHNPTKDLTESPCAWKDRCIPLQSHAASLRVLPADILKGMRPEQIVQLTTRLRTDFARRQVPVPEALAVIQARKTETQPFTQPVPLFKFAAEVLPAVSQVAKKGVADSEVSGLVLQSGSSAGGVVLLQQLWTALQARLPKRHFMSSRDLAKPGNIFLQDRTPSGYVSLYCEPDEGRRIAIAEIKLKMNKVHALFPFSATHKLLSGTDAKDIKDGKFISIITNIPGTITIQKLVDIIARSIETRVVPLPKLGK